MNRNVTSVLLVTGYNELQIDAVGNSEKQQKHQRMGGFWLVIRYNFELCLFCDVFFIVYLCACAHICAVAQVGSRRSKHFYSLSRLACPIFIFLYGMHGFYFCKLFFFQKWCYMKHLEMFQRLPQTTKNLPCFPFCAFYCIYFAVL